MADMSKYLGSKFFKLSDVEHVAIRGTITDIDPCGQFGRPVITLDNAGQLTVNVGNTRVLAAAYSLDSDNWLGQKVELYKGMTKVDGKDEASLCVRPISPPIASSEGNERKALPPKPRKPSSDFGDDVAF